MPKGYLKAHHVHPYDTNVRLQNSVKLNVVKEIQIFQFLFFLLSCLPALFFYELFLSSRFRLFLPLSCLL